MTTAETPKLAASRLLEIWWREEQPLHAALQIGSRKAQRESLGRAASYFRVVRSLKRSCDEGLGIPRYEPLRRCIARVTLDDASDRRFTATTVATARRIAAQYDGHSFLSLASKLLWVKYLHPFIIYDSVVRQRLGTPRGDYEAYVGAWHERYAHHESAIRKACSAMARTSRSWDPPASIDASVAIRVSREEWFRRRVFDIILWHGGA